MIETTAMNSPVRSRRSSRGPAPKGPSPAMAPQIAMAATITFATAAPLGPKRKEAQMRRGKGV